MHIDIEYFGHSAFLISSDNGTSLFVDPYQKTLRYPALENLQADMVLITHNHQGHNNFQAFNNNPAIIIGEGERELGWVKIKGIHSFHDKSGGRIHGSNTIFCWSLRSFTFCHLGDLGDIPSNQIYQEIGQPDFLFIPVGGSNVLSPGQAQLVIDKISPKYVIPMHYKTNNFDCEFSLDDFIKTQREIIISPVPNKIRLRREDITQIQETNTIKFLEVSEES